MEPDEAERLLGDVVGEDGGDEGGDAGESAWSEMNMEFFDNCLI